MSRTGQRSLTQLRWPARTVVGVAMAAMALYGAARLIAYSTARYGAITPDGTTYTAAVERWLAGISPYTPMQSAPYLLTDASWGMGFVYPPTALPIVGAFNLVGVELWRFLNLGALILAALLVVRKERGRVTVLSAVATLAYLLINPFVWSAWANAQITPALVALMTIGYVYPRTAGPGALIGGLVKVYPVAMLLWAFRERRWRGIRDGIIVGAALVALSMPFVGHEWSHFLVATRNALPSCNVGDPDSIRCIVGEPYGQLIALAIGGAVSALSLAVRDRRIAFACLMFGIMLTSPDLNWAYWLLPSIGLLPALAGLTPSPGVPLPARLRREDQASAGPS